MARVAHVDPGPRLLALRPAAPLLGHRRGRAADPARHRGDLARRRGVRVPAHPGHARPPHRLTPGLADAMAGPAAASARLTRRHRVAPDGRLRRVRAVPRERRRVRPARTTARRPCAASGRGRAAGAHAQRAGVGRRRRPSSCSSTAARRTPTRGTPWRWRSAGRCVAIDLPGHGHSDWRTDARLPRRRTLAVDVAVAVERLAPDAAAVVGMSLGGLTAHRAGRTPPELVPQARARRRHARASTATRRRRSPTSSTGRQTFAELRRAARAHDRVQPDPHASRRCAAASCTTPTQRDDGTWVWRYDRLRRPSATSVRRAPRRSADAVGRRRRRSRVPAPARARRRRRRWSTTTTSPSCSRRQPAMRGESWSTAPATASRATSRSSWPGSSAPSSPDRPTWRSCPLSDASAVV